MGDGHQARMNGIIVKWKMRVARMTAAAGITQSQDGGTLFIAYCDAVMLPSGTTGVPIETQQSTRDIPMPRNAIFGN